MSDTPQQDLSQLEMAFAADPKAFVQLTNAYLQLGRYMEAMVVCKKGIKAIPDSTEGRLLLARVYAEQGKLPKAIEEMKALLAANPDAAEAHVFHGQLLDKSGKFDDAIEAWKEALRKNRHNADAQQALKAKGIDFDPGPSAEEIAAAEAAAAQAAEAEAQRQESERNASDAARRAQEAKARAMSSAIHGGGPQRLANSPQTPHTGSSLPPTDAAPADAAFAQLYAQSVFSGYQGPQQTPGRKRVGFGYVVGVVSVLGLVLVGVTGGLYLHRKHQDELLEHLKRVTTLVKKDTTHKHKEALKELEAAFKVDDSNDYAIAQYAYSLATVVERGSEADYKDKLQKALERARHLDEKDLAVAARMIALRMEGKPQEALELGLKLKEPRAIVKVELGRANAMLGKIPEMLKLAEELKNDADPIALTYVAEAYRRVGDTFHARQALDGTIKNDLDHDPSRALRALLILEDDDVTNFNVAVDDVQTLLDLGKDAVGAKQRGYATLGRAMISRRARAGREADRDIEAARLLLRNDPEMPFFDARIAVEDNDFKKAKESLHAAIKLDPHRLAPYLELAEVGARSKDWATADKALEDARRLFGDSLEVGLAKAVRLASEGKFDDAITHLKGMSKTFDVAETHLELGKTYMRKEDFPSAVQSLKTAGEKAANRAPGVKAKCYMWLGRSLAAANDHEQAITAYSEALAATSELASTYYFLGTSLTEQKKDAAAKDAFTRYLRVEPNGPYAEKAKARLGSL